MKLLKPAIAAFAAMVFVGLTAQTANAFGWHRQHHGGDPYAYRFEPRGYYPYYGSHYWRPARKVRKRAGIKAPKYYPAWGYKKRHWRHREWHRRHHGGHPRWQW